MSSSKLKVLALFPTAHATASYAGGFWHLDGVHGLIDVQAADECQLWDKALKYTKKFPESHERYLLKTEYSEILKLHSKKLLYTET